MTRRIISVLVGTITLLILGAPGTGETAGTFTASSAVTLSSKAAGADADTVWLMNAPYGDYNFSMLVLTTPAAATISTAPLQGEIVGTVNYSGAFGLNNAGCASNISATFTLFNATVGGSTLTPLASGRV